MTLPSHNMRSSDGLDAPAAPPARRAIRLLDAAAQNRIAAGEVIERPASAVKELVENAIDAGAGRIAVTIADGGRTLIRVEDDGSGIPAGELPLAVERHATSKIDGDDLVNIATLGFRGEALPSIGAVARLAITTRPPGADAAASIEAVAGRVGRVRPAARAHGTTVEIRDLFSATPARLKFLKTARAEAQAIVDTLRRLALAVPGVALTLDEAPGEGRAGRRIIDLPAIAAAGDGPEARLRRRGEAVMGAEAAEAVWLAETRGALALEGLAGPPAMARGAAMHQYLSVNGRPVRDRMLLGAVRAGYGDFLARGRHPAFALAIRCPAEAVDVNVHPGKAEVRFRDAAAIRSLIVGALRRALATGAPVAGQGLSAAALGAFRPAMAAPDAPGARAAGPRFLSETPRRRAGQGEWRPTAPSAAARLALAEAQAPFDPAPFDPAPFDPADAKDAAETGSAGKGACGGSGEADADRPLGTARAQLHETYIVAETADGLVIVDQHAAHERLVLERLKAARAAQGVARQALLIPEIVTLGAEADTVLEAADALAGLGLVVEAFGPGTVCVREMPAILGAADPAALMRDVADGLAAAGTTETLADRLDAVLSRIACHGSVRAGRRLSLAEMDALLREIEATPGAQWCNHGRPTAVRLDRARIEGLFQRR